MENTDKAQNQPKTQEIEKKAKKGKKGKTEGEDGEEIVDKKNVYLGPQLEAGSLFFGVYASYRILGKSRGGVEFSLYSSILEN